MLAVPSLTKIAIDDADWIGRRHSNLLRRFEVRAPALG
jgi:hypothetical protein